MIKNAYSLTLAITLTLVLSSFSVTSYSAKNNWQEEE